MLAEVMALNAYSGIQVLVRRCHVGLQEGLQSHRRGSHLDYERTNLVQTSLVREDRDVSIVCAS